MKLHSYYAIVLLLATFAAAAATTATQATPHPGEPGSAGVYSVIGAKRVNAGNCTCAFAQANYPLHDHQRTSELAGLWVAIAVVIGIMLTFVIQVLRLALNRVACDRGATRRWGMVIVGMLLMATRLCIWLRAVDKQSACTTPEGNSRGVVNASLSVLSTALSTAYVLLLLSHTIVRVANASSSVKQRGLCKLAYQPTCLAMWLAGVLCLTAGMLYATYGGPRTEDDSDSYATLFLGIGLGVLALSIVMSCYTLRYHDLGRRVVKLHDWRLRILCTLAATGSLARLAIDLLQLALFPPLAALCDTAGLITFLDSSFYYSCELSFVLLPFVLELRLVSPFRDEQLSAPTMSQRTTRAASAKRTAVRAAKLFLLMFVVGLLLKPIAGVLALRHSDPSPLSTQWRDVRTEFLLKSPVAAVSFMITRACASVTTVSTILLIAFVHRYLSHVVFLSSLGIHHGMNHSRVKWHKLFYYGLTAAIIAHVASHTVAAYDVSHNPSIGCKPAVYTSVGTLYTSYPAITGYIMIAAIVVCATAGIFMTRWGNICPARMQWGTRHSVHLTAAFVYIVVFWFHGADRTFCTPPVRVVVVLLPHVHHGLTLCASPLCRCPQLNGYILGTTMGMFALLYLAGQAMMPATPVIVTEYRLLRNKTGWQGGAANAKNNGHAILCLRILLPDTWSSHESNVGSFVLVAIQGADETHEHPYTLANYWGVGMDGHRYLELYVALNNQVERRQGAWSLRLLRHATLPAGSSEEQVLAHNPVETMECNKDWVRTMDTTAVPAKATSTSSLLRQATTAATTAATATARAAGDASGDLEAAAVPHDDMDGGDMWELLPRIRIRGPFKGPISAAINSLQWQREDGITMVGLLSTNVGVSASLSVLRYLAFNAHRCGLRRVVCAAVCHRRNEESDNKLLAGVVYDAFREIADIWSVEQPRVSLVATVLCGGGSESGSDDEFYERYSPGDEGAGCGAGAGSGAGSPASAGSSESLSGQESLGSGHSSAFSAVHRRRPSPSRGLSRARPQQQQVRQRTDVTVGVWRRDVNNAMDKRKRAEAYMLEVVRDATNSQQKALIVHCGALFNRDRSAKTFPELRKAVEDNKHAVFVEEVLE